MSDFIQIIGGSPISGQVSISGAKNAALPMLMATLLTSENCEISNVPNLQDVNLTLHLLEHLGAEFEYYGNCIKIRTQKLSATEANYSLVKALRASFWVLGPLLARGRAARVALPGGDIIGARPVDMHLDGLAQMGAEITLKHGVVYATAKDGLKPARVVLRFPSVGATHQIIMAAALTPGTTVIEGAAKEPEVIALAEFINRMGGDIEGAGSATVIIRGKEELGGAEVKLIGDRIEAGTYLLAAIATGGVLNAEGIDPAYFGDFLNILTEMNVQVSLGENSVSVSRNGPIRPVQIKTGPYPECATDFQALLCATLTLADGVSGIEETVFEGRFGHVAELAKMGARIQISDRHASITGVTKLSGAPVEALDIRCGACLVIAALAAQGESQILEPQHLRRGYEQLEKKLGTLGAKIWCRESDAEDFLLAGC